MHEVEATVLLLDVMVNAGLVLRQICGVAEVGRGGAEVEIFWGGMIDESGRKSARIQ